MSEKLELKSHWYEVQGCRMHVRVRDDAAPKDKIPVVLVHGLGVSGLYLVPTAERLAPWYRVYVPDFPGFGRSEKPEHVLNLSEMADTLVAWMDVVGLEKAVLLGNSLGCQTIVEFALRHPQRITKGIMVGPTIDPNAISVAKNFMRVVVDSFVEAPTQPLVVALDYLRAGVPRCLRTLHYALYHDMIGKLPRVHTPILVVRGGRDPIVPEDWAKRVSELLPDSRFVSISGAPHTVNYSTPDALVAIVKPFLEGTLTTGDNARAPALVVPT